MITSLSNSDFCERSSASSEFNVSSQTLWADDSDALKKKEVSVMLNRILMVGALGALVTAVAAPAARAADDNLLQSIKNRGMMRVCDVDYAPWNVKNPGTNQW